MILCLAMSAGYSHKSHVWYVEFLTVLSKVYYKVQILHQTMIKIDVVNFIVALVNVLLSDFRLIVCILFIGVAMDQSPINQNFDLNKSRQNFIIA